MILHNLSVHTRIGARSVEGLPSWRPVEADFGSVRVSDAQPCTVCFYSQLHEFEYL